jgi:hypothetical protein
VDQLAASNQRCAELTMSHDDVTDQLQWCRERVLQLETEVAAGEPDAPAEKGAVGSNGADSWTGQATRGAVTVPVNTATAPLVKQRSKSRKNKKKTPMASVIRQPAPQKIVTRAESREEDTAMYPTSTPAKLQPPELQEPLGVGLVSTEGAGELGGLAQWLKQFGVGAEGARHFIEEGFDSVEQLVEAKVREDTHASVLPSNR